MAKKSNYYERNAERLKLRQKNLYDNDSEFRKIQIQRSIDSRKKRRAREKEERSKMIIEKKVWKKVQIGDKIYEMCRVGFLAEGLGRSVLSIRKWQREGLFPKTVTIKKQRYFTREQYNLVLRIWQECDNGNRNHLNKFFNTVRSKWISV